MSTTVPDVKASTWFKEKLGVPQPVDVTASGLPAPAPEPQRYQSRGLNLAHIAIGVIAVSAGSGLLFQIVSGILTATGVGN